MKCFISAVALCVATVLAALFLATEGAQAAPTLQLPWPPGVAKQIAGGNSYGCGTHTGSHYYAVDFALGLNESVSAAASGTITSAANAGDGFGLKVVIDHSGGYTTFYAHLNTLASGVTQGSYVSQSMVIGYADATGYTQPPGAHHLHFVAQLNGSSYAPEPMSGIRGFGQFGACGTVSPSWISRHPTDVQKVTDSTGNGRDDAVAFYQETGRWFVAPSTGSSFGAISQWISAHGIGSTRQLSADVNNDSRTDSVVWFASTGAWWVSLSNGSQYLPYTMWISGHGIGSTNQFLADANADERADAVIFQRATGQWWVAKANSSGTGFLTPTMWVTGHGVGSDDQLLADASGDGRADAIIWFGDGRWYVAKANTTGTGFLQYTLWVSGHGIGSDRRFAADGDGDGDADAVVFFGANGQWFLARANPALNRFDQYTMWISGHGIGSDNQMMADANGDAANKADAIIYIGQNRGEWWVGISTGSGFATPTRWRSGFGIGS